MNNKRLAAIRAQQKYHILPIKPGFQLEVHESVGEGNNKRTWKFKGLVIKVNKPNHPDGTFIMRGKVAGHVVEKIYPLSFVKFEKVIVIDVFKVRRAKLYYIREKIGKDARMKSISTQEQRGVDLLTLAKEEAERLYASVQTVVEDAPTPETTEEETTKGEAEEQTQQ